MHVIDCEYCFGTLLVEGQVNEEHWAGFAVQQFEHVASVQFLSFVSILSAEHVVGQELGSQQFVQSVALIQFLLVVLF